MNDGEPALGDGVPGRGMHTVAVLIDDLAFLEGEAIARPVTSELGATTPLLRRLEAAGGANLARQLKLQDALPVGSAVVTGAGDLGVELLVHAVVSSRDEPVSRSSVRRATTSALQRAADWQIAHLVFAPFGLGAGNLDPDESADVMLDAISRHLGFARYPERVTVVVENEDEHRAFSARTRA